MAFVVLLMLLQQLQLFAKACLSNHLRRDLPFIEPFWNLTKPPSDRPDMLNRLKKLIINSPLDRSKKVENIAHILKV
jgi:hypothetical protein